MDRVKYLNLVETSPTTVRRDDFLENLCRGKSVLDVGCIGHTSQRALEQGDQWLHSMLSRSARSILGVDYLEDDARILNNQGFQIIAADVQNLNLGRVFEVLVAADIIEHLDNVGMFLASMKRHMDDQSILVMTTPNPFSLGRARVAMAGKRPYTNEDHTMWICPTNMFRVVERAQLEIVGFQWTSVRSHPVHTVKARLWRQVSKELMKRRPLSRTDYAIMLKRREVND